MRFVFSLALPLFLLTVPDLAHARAVSQKSVAYQTNETGATARCRDGTLSYSAHRRGTCSHHHGVAQWFTKVNRK